MSKDISFDRSANIENMAMINPSKSNTKLKSENENISLFLKDTSLSRKVDSFGHVDEGTAISEENLDEIEDVAKRKAKGINLISNMIETAVAKHKDVNIKDVDVKYWANKINLVSTKYNFPASLIVGIIEKESNGKFEKNVDSPFGAGPMQTTTITVQDFFPGAKGNRYELYKLLDSELVDSIVYTNAARKAKRAASADKLRDMAARNDELGLKMGVLAFEMKFIEAVADFKHINAKKAITGLQDGTVKLTEAQAKQCVTTALKNYNSVFKEYAEDVINSLQKMGFKFQSIPKAIKANKH